MKLHRMEITAFGPFAKRETVDFDVLNEAGVFLLNGETGSGKTSVLDAICFALYGSGPTTAAKGGRKAQHSDHADPRTGPRVELEFTAGGRRWHVSRTPAWREPSSRAASGWSDRHATVSLREHVAGEWVDRGYRPDDVGQTIHHVVGLDREQFTQVMMLPQGQFARFLQAGSKEREDLLETLFGTDVYADIQDELKTRSDRAKSVLYEAEREAERADEVLARLRERVTHTVARLPEDVLSDLPGALRTRLDLPSDEGAIGDVAVGTAADANGGETDADSSDQGRASTSAASAASEEGPADGISGDADNEGGPDRWRELVDDCDTLVDTVGRARDGAASSYTGAQQRYAQLETLHSLVRRRGELTRRRDELAEHAEQSEGAARQLREHEAAQELQAPLVELRDARRRVATLDAAVTDLRATVTGDAPSARVAQHILGPDASLMDAVDESGQVPAGLRDAVVTARESARGAVAQEESLTRDEEEAARERKALSALEERATHLTRDLASARDALTRSEELHRELLGEVKDEALVRERARTAREAVAASREYARARAEEQERARRYREDETARRAAAQHVEALEAQRYASAAATLATGLEPGDPCPVCGATEHPHLAGAGTEDEVTDDALDRARAARDTAQDTVDASHAAWQRAQTGAAEALARGADTDVDAAVDRCRHADEELARLEQSLTRVRRGEAEIAAARREVQDLEGEGTRINGDIAGTRARLEGLLTRCDRVREGLALRIRGFDSATEFLERSEHLVRTVNEWESQQRALEAAQHEVRTAQGAVERALDASPFETESAADEALMDPADAAGLSERLTALQEERDSVSAELATQDMQRAEGLSAEERAGLSEEALARTAAERDGYEQLRDALNQKLGGLQTLAADAASHAEHMPARHAELERARENAQRLSGLADVATANSPENALRMTLTSFVLAAKLEHVAAVASEHLARMSSGRFTLVHTDRTRGGGKSGLGLEIDDSWTGVRRGTETLSGGESFFTSLALALALADVVRSEAGGQEIDTLFVDEGFGSLDEQTLEQVLETLDGLRRTGRVIGVVSHVSEMKQRIDTQLVVTKTPGGSHLSVVAGPWDAA